MRIWRWTEDMGGRYVPARSTGEPAPEKYMSLSVNNVGAASQINAQDPSARASSIANRMMKDLDADGDGKITKDEFVAGLQAKGLSAEDAAKHFDEIDSAKTGSIGKSDIEAAVKDGRMKPPPRGAPPAGAKGGGSAGSAGGSASKSYDKEDLNKDGTVTTAERLIYDMRKAAAQEANGGEKSKGQGIDELA